MRNGRGALAVAGAGLVGLALGVSALASLGGEAAAGTFPGSNGPIAYSGWDGGDYEIFTIPKGGGQPKQVTNNAVDDRKPSWSPRGGRIAYERKDANANDTEIYTVSTKTGATEQRVTDNEVSDDSPSWSPDGKRIAYNSGDGGPTNDIYSIPAGGGQPTNVTGDSAAYTSDPSWSPDGTVIAYASFDGTDYEIYTIPAAGGQPTRVTDNAGEDFDPSWSPRGNRIAYAGGDGTDLEIYSIPAAGGQPARVTDNADDDWAPSWSPDGKRIAYQGWDGSDFVPGGTFGGGRIVPAGLPIQDYEVYTVPAGGGQRVQVTDNDVEDRTPDWRTLKKRR